MKNVPDLVIMLMEGAMPRRDWYRNWYLKSDHWHRFAHKRKRVKKVCQDYGQGGVLDCHHLNYDHIWHERARDVVVVCRSCHNIRHEREKNNE